jgi:ATP-dependent protease ClpP protease subunit
MNELIIYGDIGESMWGDSVTASSVKNMLDRMDQGDLTVRINSPGGSVFDGFAIYNMIRQRDGKTTVYVDGLAASAASVIAMAGDDVVMGQASMLMIHDPYTMSVGGSEDMRKTADMLDKIKESIVAAYESRSEQGAEIISQMMTDETWFTADESVSMGFANRVEAGKATVSNLSRPWINKMPETVSGDPAEQNAWRVSLRSRQLELKAK